MMSDTELEKLKNEVLRKIGRNLLNYQKIEHMLKFIITNGNIVLRGKNAKEKQEQLSEAIQKQTMGMLIDPYVKNTYSETGEIQISTENPEESFFTFAFKVESDDGIYDAEKQELATIVADRNELVHHLLLRLDLNTIEGCKKADNDLQLKHDALLPKFESLKSLALTLQEGRKILGDYLQSEEYIKQFELQWLRESRIISMLIDIASQATRHDGWTLLSLADELLHQNAPDEIAGINERYGCNNLKQLILKSELFDFMEEHIVKGGVRQLYRIKSEQIPKTN